MPKYGIFSHIWAYLGVPMGEGARCAARADVQWRQPREESLAGSLAGFLEGSLAGTLLP